MIHLKEWWHNLVCSDRIHAATMSFAPKRGSRGRQAVREFPRARGGCARGSGNELL
jgi:hypothetical protein